jgi:choline-sulfatase
MSKAKLSRRNFLHTAAASSALTMSSSSSEAKPENANNPTQDRPNVLIIMTDQHRADLMTCAGRDWVPTPNIDKIAKRGVRFTNAYCPYPVCVASRMSMLTGLYPHTTGTIKNTDTLDWRYRTMAHHFADHGYLTGLVGKMHFVDSNNHGFQFYTSINDWLMYLGPKQKEYAWEIANHPLNDYFFRVVYDTGAGFPDLEDVWDGPSPWVGKLEKHDFNHVQSPLETEDHLDSFIARQSVKFLQRYKDQPFFLVTSFMKPHSPFYPPREYAEKYPIHETELPPVGDISSYPEHIQQRINRMQRLGDKRLRAHRAGYRGSLAFVDTCIGTVYNELEHLGLLDNTIVVYTSDHGEMNGEHGLFQKFSLFEPAVAVPLIVSYPKHLSQNQVTNALTEQFGLYPTLTELVGLPQPQSTTVSNMSNALKTMEAYSFADVIRNPASSGPQAAFSEYDLKSKIPRYMIRTHRYKYIYNEGVMDELYDHEIDPHENVNRINQSEYHSIKNELKDQLFAWYNPDRNPWKAK